VAALFALLPSATNPLWVGVTTSCFHQGRFFFWSPHSDHSRNPRVKVPPLSGQTRFYWSPLTLSFPVFPGFLFSQRPVFCPEGTWSQFPPGSFHTFHFRCVLLWQRAIFPLLYFPMVTPACFFLSRLLSLSVEKRTVRTPPFDTLVVSFSFVSPVWFWLSRLKPYTFFSHQTFSLVEFSFFSNSTVFVGVRLGSEFPPPIFPLRSVTKTGVSLFSDGNRRAWRCLPSRVLFGAKQISTWTPLRPQFPLPLNNIVDFKCFFSFCLSTRSFWRQLLVYPIPRHRSFF